MGCNARKNNKQTLNRRYSVVCGNKMPARCNRWFIYCRSNCLHNMFRAPLCPSSGAQQYYTGGCCLWYLMLWFSSCRAGVELRAVCPVCGMLQHPSNWTHRITAAAEMKYMRRTAGYTWADYKTNTQISKELKITPILDKLLEYKRNWIQHVKRMPRNRLPRVIKHYSPTGRRNHGSLLTRLLDT